MGYKRITPKTRAAILTAIRHPAGRSRAAIAREHNVAARTVQRIADEAGITNPWCTADTRAATQSATDRRRATRSQLADDLLADAQRLRALFADPAAWRKTMMGPEGAEQVRADDVEIAAGIRNHFTSIGIAVDKTIVIDRHDTGDDTDAAASMLGRLADNLAAAAGRAHDGQ